MSLLIALALLVPLSDFASFATDRSPGTVCRGTLAGREMTTTFELANGYRLQGQWVVDGPVRRKFGGVSSRHFTDLRLESLVESDAASGHPVTIPIGLQLRLETEARTQLEALRKAISAWCGIAERAAAEGVHFAELAPAAPWRRT